MPLPQVENLGDLVVEAELPVDEVTHDAPSGIDLAVESNTGELANFFADVLEPAGLALIEIRLSGAIEGVLEILKRKAELDCCKILENIVSGAFLFS